MSRLLYYYSLLFSTIIIVSGLTTGFAFQNILATLLFLPVFLYFTFTLARNLYLKKLTPKSIIKNPKSIIPASPAGRHNPFSFSHFLSQKSPTYLLTIGLYCLVLAVTLFRATLNFIPGPAFVSPIPGTP